MHVTRTVERVQLNLLERIDFWLAEVNEEKSIFALSLMQYAFI